MKHEDLVPKIEDILKDCQPFLSMIGNDPKFIPVREIGNHFEDVMDITLIPTRPDRNGLVNHGTIKPIIENTLSNKNIPSRYKHVVICSSLGKNTLFGFDEDLAAYIIPKGNFTYAYIHNDFNSGTFSRIGNMYVQLSTLLDDHDLSEYIQDFDKEFKQSSVEQLEEISQLPLG